MSIAENETGSVMTLYQDVKRILLLNKDTTKVVVVYALAVALLSLIIPVSVQSLINIVSFGTLLQPILVLTIVLFVILSLVAGIRVLQAIVVETIQQSIFAKLSIQIAKHIPKLKLACFEQYRMLTVINMFFEIQTIQKSLAILLVTIIEIFLLAIFSMVLIAFYHPLLLVFDIILVLSLIIVLIWPWKQAVSYAIKECEAKHDVAEWLEEVTLNILLFKFSRKTEQALQRVDSKIITYLKVRKKHFSAILKHIVSMNIVYVLANSALLGMGGYLVVKEQISLGQLVASELLVNALLYGFVRFSYYLEDIYDLIASSTKLRLLTGMEEETYASSSRVAIEQDCYEHGINIIAENLVVSNECDQHADGPISFEARPGNVVAIYKTQGHLASLLLDTIIGLREAYKGTIMVNGLPFKDAYISELRANSMVLRRGECFSGTLRENLLLGVDTISNESLYKYIKRYHLAEALSYLPDSLESEMRLVKIRFTDYDLLKLSWIRVVVHQPKLLLIDYYLDYLFNSDLLNAIEDLSSYNGTVIISTRREKILQHYTSQVIL